MSRSGAACVAFAILVGGGRALAHPPPMATGLWWAPAAAGTGAASQERERLIIRTPRGFLIESPATNDFRFLCNQAVGFQDGDDPSQAVGIQDGEDASFSTLGSDAFLITTYARGALRGSTDGCNWAPVTGAATTPAFDVTVVPSGGDTTAYVVGGMPHQGDHFWAGRSSGTAWSALGNSDEPYTRVRVAASNPNRVYLTGIGLSQAGTEIHRLGVSDDGGKTVTDRLLSLGPMDLQARVLDVDPLHPDHLYLYVESTSAEIPERVMVSADAGQSFTMGPMLHDIAAFAQSSDGRRVWVGGKEGISRSDDGGGSFAPVSGGAMTRITCLATHGDRLYACGVLDNQLVVALSNDDGDTFQKVFSFEQVTATVDCPGRNPASAPGSVCAAALDHWRSEVGTGSTVPTGMGGASGSGGSGGTGGPAMPLPKGSSCSFGGPVDDPSGPAVALLLAALALRWRRRVPFDA